MKRLVKITSLMVVAVLLFCFYTSAVAVELPDGTVAGIPERLVVMDSDGNSVSSKGEYFFSVENMTAGEQYSKNIQIMNMREDEAYNVYLLIEPQSKQGEIDLEECVATISLSGEIVYQGKVTGKDSNIPSKGISLGNYIPGQSRNMNCTIVWNGSDAGGFIDNGEKIITSDGVSTIREQSGSESIYGEVEFRWIFYAEVDEDYNPPKTGFNSEFFIYILIFALVAMIVVVMILLYKKKTHN